MQISTSVGLVQYIPFSLCSTISKQRKIRHAPTARRPGCDFLARPLGSRFLNHGAREHVMRAIVAGLLMVAFSAGGDGGRKSPELPHKTPFAAAAIAEASLRAFERQRRLLLDRLNEGER